MQCCCCVTAAIAAAIGAYCVFRIVRFLRQDADSTIFNKTAPPAAFENTIVLITGASSGIGEALAYSVARRGGTVLALARRKGDLDRVVAHCRSLGAKESEAVVYDVLDIAGMPALVQRLVDQHGRIDILVNNAGRSQRSLAEETSTEVDEAMIRLNVLSPLAMTKAVLPFMLRRGSGRILTTSSLAGKVGSPCSSTYSASKHAVNGFSAALATEVVYRGVYVGIACPGPVATAIQTAAFAETLDRKVSGTAPDETRRMSAERCGELMAAQLHHRIYETWLAPHPFLFFTYIGQYFPAVAARLGQDVVGQARVESFRSGEVGYNALQQPRVLLTALRKAILGS
eukprot:TRINITY_DN67402_c0_g1_i1.p1 TRINITY_DN67402_c0_g1~~TRINITY_DN67402_c0_g1_i1.p1  ORF type:complete len:343 (-),score=70.11 TRINITY_DN67402_c0_g1_i1:289-1317(-)